MPNQTTARCTYLLSEPPQAGSLVISCYSDLVLCAQSPGLREQARNGDHPVTITLPSTMTSVRTIFTGMDNHTDNRGRSPQPILPEG
ncbi:MAG: hypothetical protein ACYDBB_23180 [Armatimonadota bacterium]